MDQDTPTLDHANDSILASWNEIREATPTEAIPEEKKAPLETVADDTQIEAPAGKERGADGKFVAKQPVEQAAPLAGTEQTPEELAAAAETAAKPPVESPKSLRKDLADKHWGKLDPEVQAAWTERDANYEKGIQRYKERAETADRFESAFAPYQETLKQVGATPEQAIQTLLGLDHILRHGQPAEKAALINQMAQQFNVPLEHLSQVGPLQQQLLAQAQQLHAHQAQQSAAQQQQAQRELDALTSEVVKFSEGKEHFETVQTEMYALLPGIAQQNPNATPQEKLQKAYDLAVVANPTVRAALAAQQQQKAQAEARQKAVDAKKAASVNRTPRGVISTAPAVGSMDDTIRAKAAELGLA